MGQGNGPEKKAWQRPTLPPSSGSTIGAAGLNFRVRDGNGWFPCAIVTRHVYASRKEEKTFGGQTAEENEGKRMLPRWGPAGPVRGKIWSSLTVN